MKRVSSKLMLVVSIALFVSFVMSNLIMQRFVNESTYESAGVEAYGCANITTALIDLVDLEKAKDGDIEASKRISETISWTIQHKEIFSAQYILDLEGKVLAVDKSGELEGMEIGQKHPIPENTLKHLVEHKMTTYTEDFYTAYGKETLTGIAPILNAKGEVVGISAIDFDSSVVSDRTWETISSVVGLSAIPLVLVGLVTFFYVRKLTRPMETLANELELVIEGDLTRSFDLEQQDEIGRLSRSLTKLVEQFKNILSEVSMTTTQLAATSEELYASTQNISEISEQNTQLVETVRVKSTEQTDNIMNVNEVVNSLAVMLNQISEQLKNYVKITEETVKQAKNGEVVITNTSEQMDNIDHKIEKVSSTMIELQEKSKEITQIVDIINGISKQTSMLSFNATIEAQRAGEQGKGFTIVAEEVRRLADESSTSTDEIARIVKEIQVAIENALEQTEDGRVETKQGIVQTQEAGSAFKGISDKVKLVNEDVKLSSNSVEDLSKEINMIVQRMMAAVEELKSTTETTNYVSSAIEAQNTSFTEIVGVSDVLSKQSEELQEKLTFFKI